MLKLSAVAGQDVRLPQRQDGNLPRIQLLVLASLSLGPRKPLDGDRSKSQLSVVAGPRSHLYRTTIDTEDLLKALS